MVTLRSFVFDATKDYDREATSAPSCAGRQASVADLSSAIVPTDGLVTAHRPYDASKPVRHSIISTTTDVPAQTGRDESDNRLCFAAPSASAHPRFPGNATLPKRG
jgi:hypothetical protein